MPRNLNLLQQMEKPQGAWDKVYSWVFTVGRYVIIGVEVIVLLGFVVRFSLDRKNNDLKDKIETKVNMLKAQSESEAELRQVQGVLTNFSSIIKNQQPISSRLTKILGLIPSEMKLKSISITQSRISLELSAPSYSIAEGFEQSLRTDSDYSSVQVSLKSSGGASNVEFDVVIVFADKSAHKGKK